MQQASGAAGLDPPGGGNSLPRDAERYVINLSASTTPVGLTPPTHPQLRAYTFFVSRKLENGRERFRLHMGYFDTLEQAEHMLELVREIYPAAWAGAAPGQRLHTRVVAAGGKKATRAPGRAAEALPPAPPEPPAKAAAPAAVPARKQAIVPPVAPVVACVVPANTDDVAPPAAQPAPQAASAPPVGAAAESFNRIRATIDALGESGPAAPPVAATLDGTGNTVIAPGLAQLRAAAPSGPPPISPEEALQLLEAPPRPHLAGAPAAPMATPAVTARATHPAAPQPSAGNPSAEPPPSRARATQAARGSAAPVVPPPATAAVLPASGSVPVYAVQLLWSVQPIDMAKVPQLAIFGAYRLYGAEGNREGRRWYGLRLGFFADSVSAQQVANYVRSEFTSVSVVPVSMGERDRAMRSTARPLPEAKNEQRSHGMQFIDDVETDTATSGSRPALELSQVPKTSEDAEAAWAAAASAAVQGPAPRKGAPGKRAKLRAGGGRAASKHPQRTPPQTLEQTLDALGASTLSLDGEAGQRPARSTTAGRAGAEAQSPTRFGKLLDRLTKRFGAP